jgi:RNA polymerase sigma factor (sigma-70 family)
MKLGSRASPGCGAVTVIEATREPAAVMRLWSDDRLVRGCLNGRDAAWAALLEKYKKLIYSIPVKYGLSADEATDVFQETCLALLSELPRLRDPRALPKWLMQVTSHKCLRLKQQHERTGAIDDTAGRLSEVADTGRRSDQLILEVEREQALREAMSTLSPRCLRLIQMLFFESPSRPYQEIARTLNLACGSIGFIRGRCLERLRARLLRNGFR